MRHLYWNSLCLHWSKTFLKWLYWYFKGNLNLLLNHLYFFVPLLKILLSLYYWIWSMSILSMYDLYLIIFSALSLYSQGSFAFLEKRKGFSFEKSITPCFNNVSILVVEKIFPIRSTMTLRGRSPSINYWGSFAFGLI